MENKSKKSLKTDINKYTNTPFTQRYHNLQIEKSKLPVYNFKDNILKNIKDNNFLVIQGETGSGKTTQIPQYLLDTLEDDKRIVCTQPRRVAAISVAKRVSEELDVTLGEHIGYSVRFDDNTNSKTLLKYCTEGMLMRELITDKMLSNYKYVIVDEAHERTVNTDILLGILKELCLNNRKDLKVIVMSATLETEVFKKYFNNCPVLKIPGKMYPVELFYTSEPEKNYLSAAISTAAYIHIEEEINGDILVFLTGEEDIEYACETLYDELTEFIDDKPFEILPLYSALPPVEQLKIFEKYNGKRKIIFSTNLAETSLTIDGVVYVVDCGLHKQKIFNARTRVEMLTSTAISKSSADQRAGRAGRTRPGKCYRLYTEECFEKELEPTNIPEILRTNLMSAILMMKKVGIDNVVKFEFISPPPSETFMRGLETLFNLGCFDENVCLTNIGKMMGDMPLDPTISRCIISSFDNHCINEVVSIASMLSIPYVFNRDNERKNNAFKYAKFAHEDGDHLSYLLILQSFEESKNKRQFSKDNNFSFKNLSFALDIKKQLINLISSSFNKKITSLEYSDPNYKEKILRSLLSGFFFNCAFNQKSGTYVTIKDNQMLLIHPSTLLESKPDFIMYNEFVVTSKNYARVVSAINPEWMVEANPYYFDKDSIKNHSVKIALKNLLDIV